jgi:serine/threonine protein kinase
MAKLISVGKPVNDSERAAIAHLQNHLPDSYTILHNFEYRQGREIFEIDLAVLAPHAVYLVDVKGTHGTTEVYGGKWFPERGQPYHSPLAKLRSHAKALKGIICDYHRSRPDLNQIHVHAAVILTAADARLIDSTGRDAIDVVGLEESHRYFTKTEHVPEHRRTDIRLLHSLILSAINGKVRPRTGPQVYRDWELTERLGGDDGFTDYRARHTLMPHAASALLRVYTVDPLLDVEARESERNRIGRAYRSLTMMPSHPNIVAAREFFPTEDEDRFVLVTEDLPGNALRQHLRNAKLALTHDQKLRIARDLLAALDHAHRHHVVHRNLTPDAIMIGPDGRGKLTSFEYSRIGESSTTTIAHLVGNRLNTEYQAPELLTGVPSDATPRSDLFSAGLVIYELLVGEAPFASPDEMISAEGRFPIPPSEAKPTFTPTLDAWLQRFCLLVPEERWESAAEALSALDEVLKPEEARQKPSDAFSSDAVDLKNLPPEHPLGTRFIVKKRLGKPGGFGVVYKVFDTIGDATLVIKLIVRDRESLSARLKHEYKALNNLPRHDNVVKLISADYLPDETPYLLFEYVKGLDVGRMIEDRLLSSGDAVSMALQAATGLAHLHKNNIYHQDIKPANILWTDQGVKLIDFNVAFDAAAGGNAQGGGTRKYVPPDYDMEHDPTAPERVDRDLYALGITLYQAITGEFPFAETDRTKSTPTDPTTVKGCETLKPELVRLMLKMIAPKRSERFDLADELIDPLNALSKPEPAPSLAQDVSVRQIPSGFEPARANTNPFVDFLLTLYSQSRSSNAGTRGLDEHGKKTYVQTLLDTTLAPAILSGEYRLVIISGNAGDGKTAFLQQLESRVRNDGATFEAKPNGAVYTIGGRTFRSNYDGSQDEGDRINDVVLSEFLGPYSGRTAEAWPDDETRLIAINEGRLIDFLQQQGTKFHALQGIVEKGLKGAAALDGVAVINLNLRAVVAGNSDEGSIFDRQLELLTDERFWQACLGCDLRDKCYIHHNAQTLADPVAGAKVVERLRTLYTITHARRRMHITLRDLRSALAYTIAGTRNCDAVHDLYAQGDAQLQIVDGFYFNSWMGGEEGSSDRLLSLLREIDIAEVSNPEIDRSFDFLPPEAGAQARFTFANRGSYDQKLFSNLYDQGVPDETVPELSDRLARHRRYVGILRRRYFFERRDDGWREMLPHRTAHQFIDMISGTVDPQVQVKEVIAAINRGEGIVDPAKVKDDLALRVRKVERGRINSYRLFEGTKFTLRRPDVVTEHTEHLPQALEFEFPLHNRAPAKLMLSLDVYEMLMRLHGGYRPSIEEMQGLYLQLAVFKNILSSAPYQEVLLTETGHQFHRIRREKSGVLVMEKLEAGVPS